MPPSVAQAPAVNPAGQARIALHTRSVRLGPALIFAPLRTLKPASRLRALAVTCAVRCALESAGRLSGESAAGLARTRVSPGHARVVTLRLSAAQRRKMRRTHSARVVFRVTTHPVTGGTRSARVSLKLRG